MDKIIYSYCATWMEGREQKYSSGIIALDYIVVSAHSYKDVTATIASENGVSPSDMALLSFSRIK